MVPHQCPTLVGGRGGGLVGRVMWPCGRRGCMVAVLPIPVFPSGGSGLWPVVGEGIVGLPGCRTRAVRSAAKILLTRAACAACASCSVRIAGDTCPAANVQIWWIAKTGHKSSVVGGFARSRGGMIPACCGHPGGTSMSLTTFWSAAISVGPTRTGSRGHFSGARCRPCRTRWPSVGLGAGPGARGWGHAAGPCPWGAWSQRPPSPGGVPAVAA